MLSKIEKLGFIALAAVAFAITAQPAPAQAKADDDTVVAVVNGNKILKKEVMGAIKQLPVKPEDADKVFPVIVDQIINEKLFDIETAKTNIESSPLFQERLAAAKTQLVKSIYLENYLKDRVNDKTVKAEYDRLKKLNKGKQEVHARHILVKTEEEAKQAIKDLDNGAKFENLARERSAGPAAQNGGDVGYFAKGELLPEFTDAAFALKPGTYTKKPVKTQFGWHVIYSQDKRYRTVPDLKTVDAQIRQKLGQDAIEQLVQSLRSKAEIQRFGMDGQPVPAQAAPAAAPTAKN